MSSSDSSFLQSVRNDLKEIKTDLREVKSEVGEVKEVAHAAALANQESLNEISKQAETASRLASSCHEKVMEHEKECLREKTRARRNVWGAKEWIAMITAIGIAGSGLVASVRGMKAAESPEASKRAEYHEDTKEKK